MQMVVYSEALNMIGRDGFRGANQNSEYVHGSQWAAFSSQPIRRPETVPKGFAADTCLINIEIHDISIG